MAAQHGRNTVFFPEGTFTAQAGVPVVPGILRGTRSMLRSDQWFPRSTMVPSGTDFASLLRLRDAVRKVALARCGEPDLTELVKPARPGGGASIVHHNRGDASRVNRGVDDPGPLQRPNFLTCR